MKIQPLTPTPATLEELGRRLAQVRKQRGHSQEALAEQAGLGVATLRRIEGGKDARLGSWLRLLQALEMTAAIDLLLPEDYRSPMTEVLGQRRRQGRSSGPDLAWGDEAK